LVSDRANYFDLYWTMLTRPKGEQIDLAQTDAIFSFEKLVLPLLLLKPIALKAGDYPSHGQIIFDPLNRDYMRFAHRYGLSHTRFFSAVLAIDQICQCGNGSHWKMETWRAYHDV
jgi:hypothetical protein